MHRRKFLGVAAGLAACSILDNYTAHASQSCGPIFQAPYPPPHGMRQCTAGLESFSFVSAFQAADEWCWAACISMVFNYYHHPVSQQRIVQETWGQIVDMPAQNADIMRDLNRTWRDDNGVTFRSAGDVLETNATTAVLDLQQNRPLIIGALGHAMVLTALTSNIDLLTNQWAVTAATVRDPWPTNGVKRVLTANEWNNIQFASRIRVG